MADAYAKTDAGRREIRERAQSLSRPARNLLLIIDASKPGDTWLKLVQGASADDLAHLLASGLIGPQPQVEADRRGLAPDRRDAARDSSADRRIVERAAAAAPIADNGPLVQALQALSYVQLYDLITAEARSRLGLIKGYKMVLEVERCKGPDEIRALALRFVEMVRLVQGDAEAAALCRILGAEA